MPGGIDPHTHMELLFMGTVSADDFEWGTKAALSGGTTTIVDFCIEPEPVPDRGVPRLAPQVGEGGGRLLLPSRRDLVVGRGLREMGEIVNTHGVNTFKHFMAYKGALMVDDDVCCSVQALRRLGATALVHAENGDVVAQMQADFIAKGKTGPEFHAYSRPPEVEGEAANGRS